ncbi:hypothetical protein METHB2_90084 [Candidatus Methylobacter favarea]|uniref:Uncharacterized protein n=1 Tax=Candidatus Methylobacter favarea TaxID=2707345 RepID=A0A8S0YB17_9GAMM|nr:hypothetical protein METHB2_90084 [Candidatus Methylobacter favarea]
MALTFSSKKFPGLEGTGQEFILIDMGNFQVSTIRANVWQVKKCDNYAVCNIMTGNRLSL